MNNPEHTVAGVFEQRDQAARILERLRAEGIVPAERCELVGPDQGLAPGTALATSRATRRSLWRWHVGLGFAGLLVGLVLAAVLRSLQPAWFAVGDGLVFAVAGLFGATAGLLLAGAIGLRPDLGWFFSRLRERTGRGRWAVLVRARSAGEHARARAFLEREARSTLSSL